jgi:phosphoribosylformylglycinamidine synthase subunit PurL
MKLDREQSDEFQQKLKHYRLTEDEYKLAKSLLGRELHPIEWPLFSSLWSEHCSYKSSKNHLKKFSFRNESTPLMDGENAGVVDLGFNEKIAFKMESHNHPSYIEPLQGAATGVGGILRDIFTMGARPIALADYLCFGDSKSAFMDHLKHGVVKGISSYGNCVGVPTVTGQTNFHSQYEKNILVNAMCVGYFGPDQPMALSNAAGVGNDVVYVGAKTGKDGVHGAAMASASFDLDNESKKPNIQIGDPFFEKLLIESCLDVLGKNLVVAMQDMGAAGLTSSSFEMASKGQVGLKIDLSLVPLRDSSMSPEEILLSESQERMLLICEPKKFSELKSVFSKWGLDAVRLGEVTQDRKVRLYWKNELLTDVDPDLLVERAPRYDRPYDSWKMPRRIQGELSIPAAEPKEKPALEWIYNQYDQRVGARTAQACESSVATVQLDHSKRGLSIAVGCRPELMKVDAYIGGLDAVYYPALQMALQGSKVLAVTDCLNFGNPQKKEIMSEFVASVDGISEASKKLNAPVISGNVSFYNETEQQNIISTPATGLVGIRSDVEDLWSNQFTTANDCIVQVNYCWVESFIGVGGTEFKLTETASPDLFINLVQQMGESLRREKALFNTVSAIRSLTMGGLQVTLEKMKTQKFDYRLLPNLPISEMKKDCFYGFVIVSSKEKISQWMTDYFSQLPNAKSLVKVEIIGDTLDRK